MPECVHRLKKISKGFRLGNAVTDSLTLGAHGLRVARLLDLIWLGYSLDAASLSPHCIAIVSCELLQVVMTIRGNGPKSPNRSGFDRRCLWEQIRIATPRVSATSRHQLHQAGPCTVRFLT